MFSLNEFANDKYKLLKLLYDNQIQVKNDYYTVLSQQEIADMLHFSKSKTNKLIQELKKKNFIDNFKNTRGKYIITNDGNKVITLMQKITI